MTTWSKRPVTWRVGEIWYISIVFTWDLPFARKWAAWQRAAGKWVIAGGPAVDLMPDYLANVAELGGQIPGTYLRHNPNATFTSRGCIRRCSFCAVPRLEGDLRELDDWPIRPIVCDNNLLACSRSHFDQVIDRLKPLAKVDFNQGLDARLLTKYHADRLAELKRPMIRLAFDHVRNEPEFMRAYELLRNAGITKHQIRVYVLIGWQDMPDDALYRLNLVRGLGIDPNPMRYQALDSMKRNEYVGPDWTDKELTRFMRYWSNQRHLRAVPFAEFA